jgi:hypothetical protein
MGLVSTNFNPPTHGFQFVNYFEFPDLFQVNLPFLPAKGLGELVYGLCGGMCSGALDYFNAGKQVPAEKEVDNIQLRLFRYLWVRQMNTLSPQVLEKLFTWVILDTRILARKIAQDEVPAVLQSIDKGIPCILVLIRSRGRLQITQNHQVLAIAYDHNPATKDLTIRLYDPNHPRLTPVLTMNLSRPHLGIKLVQSTGEPLRGFFKIETALASPP